MRQVYAILIRRHTRASLISTNGVLGLVVMRCCSQVERLAAGGNSAKCRAQSVFIAVQTPISLGALVLAACYTYSSHVVSCCVDLSNTRRSIFFALFIQVIRAIEV